MPIYEYECMECESRFEVLQRIDETPRLTCENCGSSNVQRVLSPGAFVFKGSGFYATDYKSNGNGKAAKSEAPACKSCEANKSCPASGSEG